MKKMSVGVALLCLGLLVFACPQDGSAQGYGVTSTNVSQQAKAITTKSVVVKVTGARTKWNFKDVFNQMKNDYRLVADPRLSAEESILRRNLLSEQPSEFVLENIVVMSESNNNNKQTINLAVKIDAEFIHDKFEFKVKKGEKWQASELYDQMEASLPYNFQGYYLDDFAQVEEAATKNLKSFTFKNISVKTRDNKSKNLDVNVTVVEVD